MEKIIHRVSGNRPPERPQASCPQSKPTVDSVKSVNIPDISDESAWAKEADKFFNALRTGDADYIRNRGAELCKHLLDKIAVDDASDSSPYVARLVQLLGAKDERGMSGFYFACIQNHVRALSAFEDLFLLSSDPYSKRAVTIVSVPEVKQLLVALFDAKDGDNHDEVTALYWMVVSKHSDGLAIVRRIMQLLPKSDQSQLADNLLALATELNPPILVDSLVRGNSSAVAECGKFLELTPATVRGLPKFLAMVTVKDRTGMPAICTAIINDKSDAVTAFETEILPLLSKAQLEIFFQTIGSQDVLDRLDYKAAEKLAFWYEHVKQNFDTWRENKAAKFIKIQEYKQAFDIYTQITDEKCTDHCRAKALFAISKLHVNKQYVQDDGLVKQYLVHAYTLGHRQAVKLFSNWCFESDKKGVGEKLILANNCIKYSRYDNAYNLLFPLATEQYNPEALVALVHMRFDGQIDLSNNFTKEQAISYLKIAYICGNEEAGRVLINVYQMMNDAPMAKLWIEMMQLQYPPKVANESDEKSVLQSNPRKPSGPSIISNAPRDMQFVDKGGDASNAIWQPYQRIVESESTVQEILSGAAFELELPLQNGHVKDMEICHITLKALQFRQLTKAQNFSAEESESIIRYLEAKITGKNNNGQAGVFVAFQNQHIDVLNDYKKLIDQAMLTKDQHNQLMDLLLNNPLHQGESYQRFSAMIRQWRDGYVGS